MFYNRMLKLQKPTMDWINYVSSAGKNRTDSYALAFGYVVARKLAIPTHDVECIVHHHRMNNTQRVMDLIDLVNETTPMQIKLAKEFVDAFYFIRYKALNPDLVPLAFNKETAIVDFFGVSKYLSKEAIALIEADSENIAQLINGLSALLADIERTFVKQGLAEHQEETDNHVAE